MEYKKYKTEDFVLDPEFRKWVLTSTAESNVFWENWIQHNPDKVDKVKEAREIILSMAKVAYQPPTDIEDEIWDHVKNGASLQEQEKTNVIPLSSASVLGKPKEDEGTLLWRYLKIAAAAMIVLAGTVFFYNNFLEEQKAELTKLQVPEELIVKSNPKGQKSTIMLSDGTKVILNSESELTYTTAYGKVDRKVTLSGEAFFEVAENPEKPFIVQTNHLSTTALGTSFNVLAYENEFEEVSLISGKVRVAKNKDNKHHEILTPGEMIQLDREVNMVKKAFDPEYKAMWRNGILYLKDTPFEVTIAKLERWYGVDFKIEKGPSKSLTCNGRFDNEYLSNVLTSLGYSAGFQFDIEDKIVHIKF
ncbi:MAG: FecR domain-containing protein [Cyclobacteriaceae bacterium]